MTNDTATLKTQLLVAHKHYTPPLLPHYTQDVLGVGAIWWQDGAVTWHERGKLSVSNYKAHPAECATVYATQRDNVNIPKNLRIEQETKWQV